MTPSLAREQFLDRIWGAADLDAVGEFWLKLYESAAKASSFAPTPTHQIELRLSGFPRAGVDQLSALFTARASASDFGFPRISQLDPDTLSLRSPPFDGNDAPPAGLGLPNVSDDAFDGLVLEIRFSARDGRGKGSSTLVLAGELRAGSFLLKSARRVGHSTWDDELASFTPWPDEAAFLAALDEFRSSSAVPEKLARKLFPPRGVDRFTSLVVSLLLVPLGKPRLAGLLVRAVVLAGLLTACGLGCVWLWEAGRHLMLAPIVLMTIIVSWLSLTFVRIESRMWRFGYSQLNALYSEFDQESPKLVPLTHAESAVAETDPLVRKYTADLTAAGFVLLGDARFVPENIGDVFFRIFGAPDGTTYLAVVYQSSNTLDAGKVYRFWPAFTSFSCHTYLRGGGSASSMNGPRHGYRRKRSGPECQVRVFPELKDPVAFAHLHAEAVAKFAADTGNPPLRQARFEEFVRLQNGLLDEERRLYADRPYTLGDHLHWYLQMPRREYRGER
jgi:hypothetical protein